MMKEIKEIVLVTTMSILITIDMWLFTNMVINPSIGIFIAMAFSLYITWKFLETITTMKKGDIK